MRPQYRFLVAVFLFLSQSMPATAAEWYLSVQPILSREKVLEVYQPLADYLSSRTGETIRIKAHRNFLAYWASMRNKNDFDFVLDAAHFTDYRLQKMGYHLLARLPDTVSFSLVTREDNLIFEVDDLLLKKVASLAPPSIGALRLFQLFPDPMRQPHIVYARDSADAIRQVLDGKAFAAMVPTSLVASYEQLNTVLTTEPIVHMGFSASPDVPQALRERVKQALLSASRTPSGQKLLQKLNLPGFVTASAENYKGYARLLKILPNF